MKISKTILGVLVLGYLRHYCPGRERARTQAEIASDLRNLGLVCETRDVREAVARLVEQGAPIGTAAGRPPGCFLCADRADFLAGRHNLVTRLQVQAKRVRRFDATAVAALSGQATFDFHEADAAFYELAAAPVLAVAGTGADTMTAPRYLLAGAEGDRG